MELAAAWVAWVASVALATVLRVMMGEMVSAKGFVPYSDGEVTELFGGDKPTLSMATLRLIHSCKKSGARVVGGHPNADE